MNKHTILMKRKALVAVIATVMVAAFSQATSPAQASAIAQRSVEGVWMVTTTPKDCITGTPVPAAAFEGLFTFHKDGTMSAWLQNAVIMVTRSPSQGVWQRDLGRSKYLFKFIHLRYDSSGFFIGAQESGGLLRLNKRGDTFKTDSTTTFFDVNGNPEGQGCADAVGTRFDWND